MWSNEMNNTIIKMLSTFALGALFLAGLAAESGEPQPAPAPAVSQTASEASFRLAGSLKPKNLGQLLFQLYRAADFARLEKDPAARFDDTLILQPSADELKAGRVGFSLPPLPAGDYALFCFQDKNGNGILDDGPFGPTEPWGYALLKAKPFARAPRWEEVKFTLEGDRDDLVVYF
jgi:uncharacterized protein (DUF2141 family)